MNTFCSYFNQGTCKSCDLITMDYPSQIKYKEEQLKRALTGLKIPELLSTVSSSEIHFRNKAKFSVTGTVEMPLIGLVGENILDQGRELLNCSLHANAINEVLPAIKKFISLINLAPYRIGEKKGELKGLILFHSPETNETYLRFILRSKESLDRIRKHHQVLLNQFPHLQCISANIQPIAHAIMEGEEEIFITEKTFINHNAGHVSFTLGPRAFVQTNQAVAAKLYTTAAEWIKEEATHKFMELFCGQGAFSFFCAPFIKEGLGIEINPDAVLVANNSAKNNHLHHLHFKAADAGKVELEISKFGPDLILLNPPRRGLAEANQILLNQKPQTVIYSSCNHESLTLDLNRLSTSYDIKKIQIFDMFPHTKHFETLVHLKLKI